MQPRIGFVTMLVALGLSGPALAQSDCRATAKSERDMSACLTTLTRAQGNEMAAAIKTLRDRYKDPSEKGFAPLLDRAQKQWVAWREAECPFRNFESRDGSGYATILLTCRFEMNGERIKVLKDLVDSP